MDERRIAALGKYLVNRHPPILYPGAGALPTPSAR
jgi:hypothetical protein